MCNRSSGFFLFGAGTYASVQSRSSCRSEQPREPRADRILSRYHQLVCDWQHQDRILLREHWFRVHEVKLPDMVADTRQGSHHIDTVFTSSSRCDSGSLLASNNVVYQPVAFKEKQGLASQTLFVVLSHYLIPITFICIYHVADSV